MDPLEKNNYMIIPGKAEMWSDSDGISWLVFLPGSEISEADLQEMVGMVAHPQQHEERFNVLADINSLHSISHEARMFAAAKERAQIYQRLALVATNPAMRLVGNFFIRFHKPHGKVRLFSNAADAKKWLLKDQRSSSREQLVNVNAN